MKTKLTKERVKKSAVDLLFICVGCAVSAYSSIGVLIPNGLTSGGITGIARILQNYLPVDFSILYYVGSMIILLACLILLGVREARKIVLLAVLFPAFLILYERVDINLLEQNDIILAVIYVGVLSGIGAGLVFSRGFSFGGTDTVAKIIHKRLLPFVSLSKILLVLDASVIIVSALVFGRNIALYALVAQVIFTKTVDFVMYGFDSKLVQVEVISKEHENISSYVLHDLRRGVSNVTVTGEYTKEERKKLVIVCSPRESMLIKDYIAQRDKSAFISVMHVEAVWGYGEGFSDIDEK